MTKSSSHSKHLENQHALGLTISSQIFCDNMSQCINIAAKDRCWLANFFLLKKVELAFPGHGETEALLLYHPPMGYSTCTLSPTTTFHGTKTLGALCEPLPMMILKRNHGSRSEICSFSRILYYQLIEFVQRQWHCKEMGPRFLKELTGVVTTGDEWYIISHNISDGSVVTLPAFFFYGDGLLSCWVLIPNSRWLFQPCRHLLI